MAMVLPTLSLRLRLSSTGVSPAFVLEGDAVEGDVVADTRQVGCARSIGAAGGSSSSSWM